MLQEDFTELGTITNLRIKESPDMPGTFSLHFQDTRNEQQRHLLTEGAARLLWYYLTQILYPRAMGSLMSRAATATISLASSMSAIFALKVADKGEHIEVIAVSAVNGWSFRFSREEGHELWALLENVLHNVQSTADREDQSIL
jgi:hypothetical protein